MYENENGFSPVEVLVALVIVGLMVAAGWFVYDRQKNTSIEQQPLTKSSAETQKDADTENSESSIPEGWKKYESEKYAFRFYYPSSAELTEYEDKNANTGELNYYSVDVGVNNGNNPALNVYGVGNYSIQTQVTTDKTLSEYLSSFGYDSNIETSNGVSRAIHKNKNTSGPSYNTYYMAKGKTVLAISLIGDIPFAETTIIDTFTFVNSH